MESGISTSKMASMMSSSPLKRGSPATMKILIVAVVIVLLGTLMLRAFRTKWVAPETTAGRYIPDTEFDCKSSSQTRGLNWIAVHSNMSQSPYNFNDPASPYSARYGIILTYKPSLEYFEKKNQQDFQVALILNMLENTPAIVFDLKPCNQDQRIIFLENPVVKDGHIQNLAAGRKVKTFRCHNMELKRRGKETKIWVSVEAKLNFATRRVDINACFGHKSTCSYVSEGEVNIIKNFNFTNVESVVLAEGSIDFLANKETMDVRAWCDKNRN